MAGITNGVNEPSQPLDAEDAKLVVLARAARARTGATQGGAVRDGDGRTYVATSIALDTLRLDALQVALAMAVSSGATTIEAAAVVSAADDAPGDVSDVAGVSAGTDAIRELAGSNVAIIAADQNGAVLRVTQT